MRIFLKLCEISRYPFLRRFLCTKKIISGCPLGTTRLCLPVIVIVIVIVNVIVIVLRRVHLLQVVNIQAILVLVIIEI